MGLFGRKKPPGDIGKEPPKDGADGKPGGDEFEPQPDKAKKWFDYAKAADDASNYEYALACWANGIKLDPEAMSAHQAMYEVAIKYMNKGGAAATGKEIRSIEDNHPVSKFAAAEFAWMKDIANASLAMKTLEAAIKANQLEYGNWIAGRVLNTLRRHKKQSKSQLVQAKDMFKQVSAWNEAMTAGQLALQLDPTDNTLDHEIKDISAQRAMDQGGYEKNAGKEGGFRTFVKDADRQRQLQDSEAIAGNLSTEERNLHIAKMEYEKNPGVPDVLNKYAQLVKKQGTPEAEQLAYDIYLKGFRDTGEYRFRMFAGDIKVEQMRRNLARMENHVQQNPTDAAARNEYEQATRELSMYESSEFNERVSKYPTNREMKQRLGEIEFALGNYDNAMSQLQKAKDEPKLRVRAGHMLGRCFAAERWYTDAVTEYNEALQAIDPSEKEQELDIRYDLMVALLEHARAERSIEHARQALEICSGIGRKDITYRDIRNRRREIDTLIREITGAPEGSSTT